MRPFLALVAVAVLALPLAAEEKKPKEKLLSPNFEKALLADVLSWLSKEAGYEYGFTPAAQKVARRGILEVALVGTDMKPWEALEQVLASVELACVQKVGGQVKIMTVKEYTTDIALELYDVRDLLAPVKDFEGPDPIGWGAGTKEDPLGPRFHDDGEADEKDKAPKPLEDPEKLPELVKNATGGEEAWTDETKITLSNGILYVRAPQSLHAKVRAFLNSLHQFK